MNTIDAPKLAGAAEVLADVGNDSRLGEFVDRDTFRFIRDFPHPAALCGPPWSTPGSSRPETWRCTGFDARLGGRFEFDISGQTWIGQITEFEPPRRLNLADHIRFDLADRPAGCRLAVTLRRPPLGWSVMALAGFHGWVGRLTRLIGGVAQAETEAWAAEIWQAVFAAYALAVQRCVAGGAKALYRLHFAANDADLDDEARSQLGDLAKVLHDRPDLHLVIDGFGDDPCEYEASVDLCRARVEAARRWLHGQCIAAERIHDGYILGNYHYLVERHSEAGRAFNRRIELRPTY